MSEFRPESQAFQEELKHAHEVIERILAETGRSIVGQQTLRRRLIGALLTDGHLLLEGVPGLAKTLSIRALAAAVDGTFQRIQFTPDLLPADLLGTEIYRPQHGEFETRRGPVFANFVLADEINRAPAKVQSALLETMQERQVTIGGESLPVPRPFFVLATQNPIEQEGTYPLPEAQIDRFSMKVRVDYPSAEEELAMLERVTQADYVGVEGAPVASLDDVTRLQALRRGVYVDPRLREYIVSIVRASREPQSFGLKLDALIELGASPRATIAFYGAAQAEALLEGEHFVVPQNIKDVAHDVLRHRIIPTYEAEAEGLSSDDLVQMLLDGLQVP